MTLLKYIALILMLTSIPLFLFGFLPKTSYRKHATIGQNYFKEKTIDKVVLIVVDSLRPDMVFNNRNMWTSVNKYINQSWAYPTIAELQPPSMSLPKIKCIVTGAVINFIDTIFNTDAGKMAQENLIDIVIKYRNFKVNLYGDETWEKLFPFQFNYSQATAPFFVRDFYEIDQEISKNIPFILSDFKAWDFVIMHYLGLDHIGHTVGPFSSYIDSKIAEMDNRTGSLLDGIFQRHDRNRTLLILTADHGMSDLGGHGGSSKHELNVPLIFFNQKFQPNKIFTPDKLYQNDIAPSLALLLGVPIPADSIGVISYRLLSIIDGPLNRTNALFSNYFQLRKIVNKLPKYIEKRFSEINSSISVLQEACQNYFSTMCLKKLENHHKDLISVMNDIKDILKNQSIHHDFFLIELAFIFIVTCLLLCASSILMDIGLNVTVPGFVFLLSTSYLLISILFLENIRFCLYNSFKVSLCTLLLILTGYTVTDVNSIIQFFHSLDLENQIPQIVVLTCLLINLLSFSRETFIKEEHQVWFYLSTTIISLYFVREIIRRILIKKEKFQFKSTYVAALVILVLDRILRTLNRTGERWSSLPDLSDWINMPENSQYLIMLIITCLPLVGTIMWQKHSLFLSMVTQLLMILNVVHRMADLHQNKRISDISAWIYYTIIVIQLGLTLLSKLGAKFTNNFKFSYIIFVTSLLICRDQNILLWTGITIKTFLTRKIWLEDIQYFHTSVQFVIFNGLGMISYFQQGNSNSLTSIDPIPGFVGVQRYIAWIVDPLVALQIYSGNLYWVITWLEWITEANVKDYELTVSIVDESEMEQNDSTKVDTGKNSPNNLPSSRSHNLYSKIILSLTMISSLFTIFLFLSSVLHKHDISAWSVYAPKLLYHCFHYGFTLILYIFIAKLHFL